MERYETEEQQVEAIKGFWKENGTAIIVAVGIALAGLFGWQQYNEMVIEGKETQSMAFQIALEGIDAEEGLTKASAFAMENTDSGYAILTSLVAAQKAVENKDFDAAQMHLNMAVSNSPSVAIADLAKVRLARVENQLGDTAGALATLDSVVSASYSDQVQEIKGDIYLAIKEFDKAKEAYDLVLAEQPDNRVVEMKLSNLNFAATEVAGVTQ
ncbi:YfgM family protein [Brumicola pallidula]|jgi:predicted negative regulator of RcsB-dependent stress response|uniref:Ancillary SecYEG translocon subunit n=1 Tax=Brumicola pallidula DSM 14239 = ACAM 615 TaxID=1121922 RepID=K6ZG54_9ALTE|nr:tetratricopeptide repeat protein [Glaciecola pallidula]GAC27913.1 TPR-like domain-containing protein [Glaciecola pallidula DSM 14239 = ACAM 615]